MCAVFRVRGLFEPQSLRAPGVRKVVACLPRLRQKELAALRSLFQQGVVCCESLLLFVLVGLHLSPFYALLSGSAECLYA